MTKNLIEEILQSIGLEKIDCNAGESEEHRNENGEPKSKKNKKEVFLLAGVPGKARVGIAR